MAPQKPAANAMEIDRLATQLAKDPQSKAFLPLAEEYCKVGMWEEAVSVLEDGLKHYPGFITAMVVLGRAYDQLNQPTKARAVLEGAIRLSPENLRAHRTLIKIYAAQDLTQEALKSCRVILSMHPKDEEALSVQASLGAQESEQAAAAAASPRQHSVQANAPQSSPVSSSEAGTVPTPASLPLINDVSGEQITGDRRSVSEARTQEAAGHAATIAQLEAWLRSLNQRRRDRPTSVSNP